MDEKGNVFFFLKKDEFEEKKRNPRGERRKQREKQRYLFLFEFSLFSKNGFTEMEEETSIKKVYL